MISAANEFENITKFELRRYFEDYRDFLQNDYSDVYAYYSGTSENIDSLKINKINNLLVRSDNLSRTFQTFSGKLGNVGYWELQQYCQDLRDTLERISKLPKYLRTAKSCRGYKPYIQINEDIGGMRTIQDVADKVGNITEQELILNNDIEEENYEIDELSNITAFVNNQNDVVVTTIIEQPIGKKIYGKDLNRKISFSQNDLAVVKYEDNIEQKCDILLALVKGDVPEFPNLGKSNVSDNYSNFNYAELVSELRDSFYQNDIFKNINIINIDVKDGSGVFMTCGINTKYMYSTTKSVKII
jgi:HPt (histidine-containing phosphotransfer) domain-containing protein